jgi:hypothetical protein
MVLWVKNSRRAKLGNSSQNLMVSAAVVESGGSISRWLLHSLTCLASWGLLDIFLLLRGVSSFRLLLHVAEASHRVNELHTQCFTATEENVSKARK